MLLKDQDKQIIIRLAEKVFEEAVKIWAYSSRVTGEAHDGSDLDLVVISGTDASLDSDQFFRFKEAIEDSSIPILVQIMDWHRIPESFKTNITRHYEVLVELPRRADRVK